MTCDVFAVIPARGGSKRIPKKNIKEVAGKPLIAHTVEQANEATTIDRVIVSTDDEEIASVAREYGGEIPFIRPARLATDETPGPPVIQHALNWIEKQQEPPTVVVKLQATSPLRRVDDIDQAVRKLQNDEAAKSVISVTEFEQPPFWAVEPDDDGYLHTYFDRDVLWTDDIPRSQDLPALRCPNGAIFAARRNAFIKHESFYTDATVPFEMPRDRSIDIDEPIDLEIVRTLAEK
ncbi:cytidylyltransferase domain-containing protein [Haloarcula sp. KBTZ06]|uniref:acylneuraminate cytidylyltransferase family protein n=1 Tax=unclassified Haloarcula TaxID=2624677 RepID=UPI00124674DF|nr:acylneuraminate cytidylyltransferase family protein [Haloarcula sp. CBA1131]KAA9406607.1 acylneuraminate cytidylyltransferase family protein [Haloarcula sp. CBA1131]